MARAPRHVISDLEEALRMAEMGENARFGFSHDVVTLNGHAMGTKDAFIKEQTRLYRETWLIPRIKNALRWAKGE